MLGDQLVGFYLGGSVMNQTNAWQIALVFAVVFPIYFSLVWYGAC
jgi:hypothetical protein